LIIPNNSFTFIRAQQATGDTGGDVINSLNDFGIKVIGYDTFTSDKRDRRVKVPYRQGTYDFGEKFFDDRQIEIDCETTAGGVTNTKAQMREFAYYMKNKGKLYLWDEPDKYYIAELMKAPRIKVSQRYVSQQITMSLLCEPFAYKDIPNITGLNNVIDYNGTVYALPMLRLNGVTGTAAINITAGGAVSTFNVASGGGTADIIIDADRRTVYNFNNNANLYHTFAGDWDKMKISRATQSVVVTGAAGAVLSYVERYI